MNLCIIFLYKCVHWHADLSNTVLTGNTSIGYESDFITLTAEKASHQGLPYDYKTLMHFSKHARSTVGDTLVPVRPDIRPYDLGMNELPSSIDFLHIKLAYCEGKVGKPPL